MENLTKLNQRRWEGQLAFTAGLVLLFLAGLLWGLRGMTPVRADPSILYVDADATGAANGTSWTDAYTNVQDALITAISDTEIWVAEGIYYPDEGAGQINDVVTSTFVLTDGVAIYGGFDPDSGADEFDERNWTAYITVLSGDIGENDTTNPNGVVTDTANINGDNAYHVLFSSGVTDTAVIDGFTITAGQANGRWDNPCQLACGGGMLNSNSSPVLINVTFSGNSATQAGGGNGSGGGMYNYQSSPVLTNVTFSGNWASSGGGMHNYQSNFGLTNVTFSGNSGGDCGGMLNNRSNITLSNGIFSGNSAADSGGGMYNNDGNLTLTNVAFFGNSAASSGGGMYNASYNLTLINVTFSGNSSRDGGGMVNSSGNLTLTNVTLSGNLADDDGGGIYNYNSNPVLTNTILWGNTAGSGGDQIYNRQSSDPTISYSDIQSSGGSGSWDAALGTDGGGNIDADPIFVSEYADLHLQAGSPAIDTGANSDCPANDLDGNPRPVGPFCDMGAYEFGGRVYLPLVVRNY